MSTLSSDTNSIRAPGHSWRRFSLFRRASSSSLNTLSSIKSAQSNLPQYSPFDSSIPSAFPTDSEWETDVTVSSPESGTIRAGFEPSSPVTNGVHVPHAGSSTVPPRYSRILYPILSLPTAGPDDGAPRRAAHIEHSFPIRSGKPWATLLTFTSSSVAGLATDGRVRKIPRFVGNEMVTGMVELDLENTQTIQEISLTLRGKIIAGYLVDEAYTFLDHKHLIWNIKSMGNPPTSSKHSRSNYPKKTLGKLIGSYQIPFCFPFPSLINFDSYEAVILDAVSPFSLASPSSAAASSPSSPWANADKKTPDDTHTYPPLPTLRTSPTVGCTNNDSICPAPPSFVESGITASIQYELTVHIVHGFLKPDSRIKTAVAYTPSVVPRSPSMKRREAYATKNIAPGPIIDQEGWVALPKVTIEGRLGGSKGRNISVFCQLYLATPLTYTRDTFIPCHLSYSGDDAEALNVMASPNAPCVRLVRRLRHVCSKGGDSVSESDIAGNTASNPEFGSSVTNAWYAVLPAATGPSGKGGSLKTTVTDMGGAVWWKPPKDAPSELYTSHLDGEIHLPVDMQPSCACPLFQIEYFVEMRPPIVTAFDFKHSRHRSEPHRPILVSHPVKIATFHSRDGTVPIAFTQPLRRKR